MKGIGFGWTDLGGLGLLGLAIYGGIKLIQFSGVAKNLDMSIKELANSTPVEIKQSVIDKATERAVDREVHVAVAETAKRVGNEIAADMKREVKSAVKSQYSDISDKVTKRIAEEVKTIHQDDLVNRIANKAEDIVADKINEETRKAAARFNKGLDGIADLYDGFAKRVLGVPSTGQSSQGLTFTVGR